MGFTSLRLDKINIPSLMSKKVVLEQQGGQMSI
jgi:hypothetical protein